MKHKKSSAKRLQEYSKRVIALMIIAWFIVALFGIAVITYQLFTTPEYVALDGLYSYVGYPMTGGIIGYLIKSAVENKQKIKNCGPDTTEPQQDCESEGIERG